MTKHIKVNTTNSPKSKKKKTKSRNLKTHVHVVLDRSGSMGSCRESTVDGFNEYLNSLRSAEGKFFVTLTQFDSGYQGEVRVDQTFTDVPLKDVREFEYDDFRPDGGTPLLDAIGLSIRETERNLKKKRGTNASIMVIMTDGGENSSKEFTNESIKKLIDEKEDDGWTITYMGANQDSWAVGNQMGFKAGKTLNYSTKNMKQAFRGLAGNTMARTAMYSNTLDSMDANADAGQISVAFAAAATSEDFFEDTDDEKS